MSTGCPLQHFKKAKMTSLETLPKLAAAVSAEGFLKSVSQNYFGN